jgi:hypothetical protein
MAAKAEGFSSGITYLSNAGSLQRVVRQSEEGAPCSRPKIFRGAAGLEAFATGSFEGSCSI